MKPCSKAFAALVAVAIFSQPSSAQQRADTEEARSAPALIDRLDSPDLIYHPVFPCRLFGTATTGKIPASQSRDFQVAGEVGFEEQGGRSGGCGVPSYARMVTLSLTAQSAEARGFASATSAGAPKVRSVSFQTAIPTTSGVSVLLNRGKLNIYTSAAAHFIGEVTGYFLPQLWATVRAEGALYMTSGRFLSARRLSVGAYEVTADQEIHYCGAVASVVLQNHYATAIIDLPPKRFVTVKVFDPSGSPADAPFTVMVKC